MKFLFLISNLILVISAATFPVAMLYPLYTYPLSSDPTYLNISAAALHFPVIAILNPANGQPTCPMNSDWIRGLQQLATANKNGGNLKTIGYVSTNYAQVALATAKAHVDLYFQCWNVSGIFFDECTADSTNIAYYKTLYTYVQSRTTSKTTVVINPGTHTTEEYMNASDINVIFESPLSSWNAYTLPSWSSKYSPERLAMILDDTTITSSQMQAAITNAVDVKKFGNVFVTDIEYTKLPSFWKEEVSFIASLQPQDDQKSGSESNHKKITPTSNDQKSSCSHLTIRLLLLLFVINLPSF